MKYNIIRSLFVPDDGVPGAVCLGSPPDEPLLVVTGLLLPAGHF